MRINGISNEEILFDNGNKITYYHQQDCCEFNYADFSQLEEQALKTDFDENLIFETVKDCGFRFGSENTPKFFIPCYSYQNGYYSFDIDIYYNGKRVLNVDCEYKEE